MRKWVRMGAMNEAADKTNHETMLQCFEWYLSDDHGLWNWIAAHTAVDICHPDAAVRIDASGRCVLHCPPRACSIYIDAGDYEVMRERSADTQ